jgi:very-short-patch-repair endonuclease
MLRDGHLRTVLPGICADAAVELTPLLLARAVMLRHPGAVLTHELAAMLTFWPELPMPAVRVAGVRSRVRADGVSYDRRTVPPDLTLFAGPLRVTVPALTAIDLSVSDVGPAAIDRALLMRQVRLADLWNALQRCPYRRGDIERRRHVLDSRDEPWSAAERLAHKVLREAKVRGWVANHPVEIRERRYYVDIAFRRERLAVEIDGRLHHDTTDAFESDRIRQNALVIAGWDVLRFTWRRLVTEPRAFVDEIRAARGRRSAA